MIPMAPNLLNPLVKTAITARISNARATRRPKSIWMLVKSAWVYVPIPSDTATRAAIAAMICRRRAIFMKKLLLLDCFQNCHPFVLLTSHGVHSPHAEDPFFSLPLSGRQDTDQQPLHQFLSKLLLRFVEGIGAKEQPVEHPLKTGPQQQGSNVQRGDMLPDASQLLLLLNISRNPFKEVVWTQAQRLGRCAKLGQEFRVSQEGDAHGENLFIVMNGCQRESGKILAQRGCTSP